MKKKLVLCGIYLLGWLYPLSVVLYTVTDHYLKIKTSLMGPYDFGNDSIMGYIVYSLILALITFLIFFVATIVKFRVSKLFYLTPLNLPIYFLVLFSPFLSTVHLYPFAVILVVIATITSTLIPFFKAEKKT